MGILKKTPTDDLYAKVTLSKVRVYKYEVTIHNAEGRVRGRDDTLRDLRYHAYADNRIVAWFKARKMLADIRAKESGNEDKDRKDISFIVR